MFTGIISGIGRILHVQTQGDSAQHGVRLQLQAPPGYLADVKVGDSISINGACMTATDLEADQFGVDVSAESLLRTAGLDAPGPVNLEKALRASDRLDGHLVSGHVDGIGTVSGSAPVGESWQLRVRAGRELARFLAYKGSIAVNGVSLTVNAVQDSATAVEFTINLIPHTQAQTTLGQLVVGQRVNLEVDLVARYVERMLGAAAPGGERWPADPQM